MSPEIKHVVVLMMENRSFDHLLGHLSHDGLQPVDGHAFNPLDPSESSAEPPGYRSEAYINDFDVSVDPGHSFDQIALQMQGTEPPLRSGDLPMNGFVAAYRRRLPEHSEDLAGQIMKWHTGEQSPNLSRLAREYVVCDRWFCSVPGETWPNRMFAHMGHSKGWVSNPSLKWQAWKILSSRNIFDVLQDNGVSWRVYAGDIPQVAFHVGFDERLKGNMRLPGEFFDDVADGPRSLPSYSFIEPRHLIDADSQHPTASVALGDELIGDVYRALSSNPEVWRHCLLIVTWDEHGGFFDRVSPPTAVPPGAIQGDDLEADFAFDRLGVRVPALIVSPWTRTGKVFSDELDHTSIIRTVLDVFDLKGDNLGDRVARATSVLGALGEESADPAQLPTPDRSLLAFAASNRSSRELVVSSPTELDGFQNSLLNLKKALDEDAGIEHRNRWIAPVDPGTVLQELVREFRTDHVQPPSPRD